MRIKFSGSDPRAGRVAEMDSRRGQELIDSGCAVQVKDDDSGEPVNPAPVDPVAPVEAKPANKSKGHK